MTIFPSARARWRLLISLSSVEFIHGGSFKWIVLDGRKRTESKPVFMMVSKK